MPIPGNPKQFVRDVADGFFVFNKATCRQFAPAELRTLYRLLEQVVREIRSGQVAPDDVAEIQRKNLRLSRPNTYKALLFIHNHARRHRIVL